MNKFFICTTSQWIEKDDQWIRVPHGYWLNEYFMPVLRGEVVPPGHKDRHSPPSNDWWSLMQLVAYLLPKKLTDLVAFQHDWGFSGSKLTPSKMLVQRPDVFKHLYQHYARCTVRPFLFLRQGTGFLVEGLIEDPGWLSLCVAEGFLLAALNVRIEVCPDCLQIVDKVCPSCSAREKNEKRFRNWVRRLKSREKISEAEAKAALTVMRFHGVERAREKLEQTLYSTGRLRPYRRGG